MTLAIAYMVAIFGLLMQGIVDGNIALLFTGMIIIPIVMVFRYLRSKYSSSLSIVQTLIDKVKKGEKLPDLKKIGSKDKKKSILSLIMKWPNLDQDEIRYLADRNLTLAGFTLTSLSLIIGFYKDNLLDALNLIVFLLVSMFLFFLASQIAHEAERFWHIFTSDILHYSGVLFLMLSFTFFILSKIQHQLLPYLTIGLILIMGFYFIKGLWNVHKLYEEYKKKVERDIEEGAGND